MITGIKLYKYEVHYKRRETFWKGVLKGKRTVTARSFAEAKRIVEAAVPGCYDLDAKAAWGPYRPVSVYA